MKNDKLFGYYINTDERGSFNADVRDTAGKTIYEIKAGDELAEGESSIFDDGFMSDKHDLDGLHEYLKMMGCIPVDAKLLPADDFEREVATSTAKTVVSQLAEAADKIHKRASRPRG